jgi:hypothetical protein
VLDQLDPSKLTLIGLLVAVIAALIKALLVLYNRTVADIERKDKLIDSLSASVDRLSRTRRSRE